MDATSAYMQAVEEVAFVDHPRGWLAGRQAEGLGAATVWRLLKVVPGRKKAGRVWGGHVAAVVANQWFERCRVATQFFFGKRRPLAMEKHVDVMHGVGERPPLHRFLLQRAGPGLE